VRRCAVYRLLDDYGRLLYVGSTVNVARRLSQHKASKWWYPRVASVAVEWYASEQQARDVEAVALEREQSEHNLDDPKRGYYRPRPGARRLEVVDLHDSLLGVLDELAELYG